MVLIFMIRTFYSCLHIWKMFPGSDSLPNNIFGINAKKIDEQWKKDLGSNWEKTHFTLLENIGNLTLTGYNSESCGIRLIACSWGNRR